MSSNSLICFAFYYVSVMRMIFAKFSHATWQALKDSRFCTGPDFARAMSAGHFLERKFGDVSLVTCLFPCKTDIYHLPKQNKNQMGDMNNKFNK